MILFVMMAGLPCGLLVSDIGLEFHHRAGVRLCLMRKCCWLGRLDVFKEGLVGLAGLFQLFGFLHHIVRIFKLES